MFDISEIRLNLDTNGFHVLRKYVALSEASGLKTAVCNWITDKLPGITFSADFRELLSQKACFWVVTLSFQSLHLTSHSCMFVVFPKKHVCWRLRWR